MSEPGVMVGEGVAAAHVAEADDEDALALIDQRQCAFGAGGGGGGVDDALAQKADLGGQRADEGLRRSAMQCSTWSMAFCWPGGSGSAAMGWGSGFARVCTVTWSA